MINSFIPGRSIPIITGLLIGALLLLVGYVWLLQSRRSDGEQAPLPDSNRLLLIGLLVIAWSGCCFFLFFLLLS